uniref:Uncharacterized protein n=1 Tax=Strombidinopsis acuminata TaxID=141414 RepID=A0A7S3WTS8_9SPIT
MHGSTTVEAHTLLYASMAFFICSRLSAGIRKLVLSRVFITQPTPQQLTSGLQAGTYSLTASPAAVSFKAFFAFVSASMAANTSKEGGDLKRLRCGGLVFEP